MSLFDEKKASKSDRESEDNLSEKETEKKGNFEHFSSPESAWKPRPVTHRILAWLGIAYVLVSIFLFWYYLIHGEYLRGIGPLMITPVLIGFGVLILSRYRSGQQRGGLAALIVMEALVLFAIIYSVLMSFPALISQL